MIQDSIQKLGLRAKDKVTGFEGTITTVGFDLYGCVQFVLTPMIDGDGKIREGKWFDPQRLEYGGGRVMEVPEAFIADIGTPDSYDHGGYDKPLP